MIKPAISWPDFEKLDLRVGTILKASVFPNARKPAYQLEIDFGPLGIRKSSAQITKRYKLADLTGKQVAAIVNFPPKQIANFFSECLVLGVISDHDEVVLLSPDHPVENGMRIA